MSNDQTPTPPEQKVGRNEPCPCGSGEKLKKCCGAESEEEKLRPGDMTSLVWMLLSSVGGGITIPASTFEEFRKDKRKFNVAYYSAEKVYRFWIDKKPGDGIVVPDKRVKKATPDERKKLIIH